MQNNELKELIKSQVKSKVLELSTWRKVIWEGGRLYFETQRIIDEISDYNIGIKIYYLETLLNEKFIIQDNWPHEVPDITQDLRNWLTKTISKLKIKNIEQTNKFLERKIEEISLKGIQLDNKHTEVLNSRIQETQKCFEAKAYLSVILLIGSTIEGILFGLAKKYPKPFNESSSAPKNKDNKVKILKDWTLNDLINVSSSLGIIDEDVKKHSHSVREFRNYIHPYEQLKSEFYPDDNTAKISWQVLKACIMQLNKNMDKLK